MRKRIREIRNDLGMTQEEFGKATGKSKSTIVNYELQRAEIDDTFIELLELKYHYRAEWIRTGALPKKLPDPDADGIARIGLDAAHLDAEKIRQRAKEKIDQLPAPYLMLLEAIWQSEEFREAFRD